MVFLPAVVMSAVPATSVYEARAKDWRCGPVVYQVFVDRFAPPADRAAKRRLYPAPKRLLPWSQTPQAGRFDPALGRWTHELDFWGGDLEGVRGRLDYIKGLGADVLYLTPVFRAFTNHKYDTEDYTQVSPEFGTLADLKALTTSVHRRKMRLMLDGVFNHMGKTAPAFQSAQAHKGSPTRDWFVFDPSLPLGYRAWYGAAGLPCLNLENAAVRSYLWAGRDSIVRRYLRQGIDGWRLDVAFDIGPAYLRQITKAAHEAMPGSAVVGEISGYPASWAGCVDGVFNFLPTVLGLQMLQGGLSGGRAGQMLGDMVADAGIENLLRSWLLIDNHDTPRAATTLPDRADRHLVQALQATLPGAPVVYYGTELGMTGGGDPACRAPMRWDLATADNPDLAWTKRILKARAQLPALRTGDLSVLRSDRLLAYVRHTDQLRQTVVVVMNPTGAPVTESFPARVGRLLSWGTLRDALSGSTAVSAAGVLTVTLQPKSVALFVPVTSATRGYSPYQRIP